MRTVFSSLCAFRLRESHVGIVHESIILVNVLELLSWEMQQQWLQGDRWDYRNRF
jgi:hypothetical protein